MQRKPVTLNPTPAPRDAPAPEIAAARQAERDLCNEIVRKAWGDKISVDAMAEIAALRAENERLRKSLSEIKLIALICGAPGEINTAAALTKMIRICINAGVFAQLDDLRAAVAPEQEEAK